MNTRIEKFIPRLRSSFDFETLSKMRDALNALLNGRISGTDGEIHYSDGAVVWEVLSSFVFQTILPFTFYNITNEVNAADTWRTFLMRDGIVAARSKHVSPFDQFAQTYEGNFEQYLTVINDGLGSSPYAQPVPNTGNSVTETGPQIVLNPVNPTIICGVDLNTGEAIQFGQIVLDNTVNPGFSSADFWVQIIDDPVIGFSANLVGKTFEGGGPGQHNGFPAAGPGIIPLAEIQASAGTAPIIYQIQIGNLINRYKSMVPDINDGTDTPFSEMTWRGPFPSGQLFWPGDIVSNGGHLYQFTGIRNSVYQPGPSPAKSVSLGDGNWNQIL